MHQEKSRHHDDTHRNLIMIIRWREVGGGCGSFTFTHPPPYETGRLIATVYS